MLNPDAHPHNVHLPPPGVGCAGCRHHQERIRELTAQLAECFSASSMLAVIDDRDRLRAALRPFAAYAAELDVARLPDPCPLGTRPELYAPPGLPTAGDCRRARAALAGEVPNG